MNSIEQNKKYKLEKKIEKLKKDYEKKLKKTQLSLEQKRQEHLQKMSSAINTKYDKKLARIKKKQQEQLEKKKREILGKKKLKKHTKTKSKDKAKALKEIQKYSKLVRAKKTDKWIMVFVIDKQKRVPLDKKVNWWHCYPQSNFAQLAFDIDNIRPITSRWNKQQLDNIWEWKKYLPKEIQEKLEKKSKNKWLKWSMRDKNFYLQIIKTYKELNSKEEKRLGIIK
mgnify:CR=1 FL=1